ncbi:MAG: hypothetical protein WCK79_08040 [Actinomycetes bacterium]|jgi:hypothetical protein
MSIPVTVLRTSLAAALENPTVWQVFSFPPASPLANSLVISPDDPYLEPQNNQYGTISPQVNFKLTLIVPLFDNQGNLADIENFITALMLKLSAAPFSIRLGTFSAPTTSPNDTGQMLMSEISISILTSWS